MEAVVNSPVSPPPNHYSASGSRFSFPSRHLLKGELLHAEMGSARFHVDFDSLMKLWFQSLLHLRRAEWTSLKVADREMKFSAAPSYGNGW